jgi:hypothetical protein
MPDLTTLSLLLFICLFMLFREFFGKKKFGDRNYLEMFDTVKGSIILTFASVFLLVIIIFKVVTEW